MKVIVNKGFAVSSYPDYMTEELILDKKTNPNAKMYRVKEGVNVLGELIPEPMPLVDEQGFPQEDIIQPGTSAIQSTSAPSGPMTEAQIKKIAI